MKKYSPLGRMLENEKNGDYILLTDHEKEVKKLKEDYDMLKKNFDRVVKQRDELKKI